MGVNQKAKKKLRFAGALLWFSFAFVLCKDVFVFPAAAVYSPNDPVPVQQ